MVWDEPKRQRNLRPPPEGHGLDFADAQARFEWDTALVSETNASKTGGRRFKAVGFLDSQLVTLTFAVLGTEAVSAISLRPASRKERMAYDDA
jgi:uncharacterized DUF497 family protein